MKLNDCRRLAKFKMQEHGLTDWKFKFNNAKTFFGLCSEREHTIWLSRHLTRLNTESVMLDTILHEIAHALAGCRHKHNRIWVSQARIIGCNGERCSSYNEVVHVPGKYKLVCGKCGSVRQIHRKTRVRKACRFCCDKYNGGMFSEEYILKVEEVI